MDFLANAVLAVIPKKSFFDWITKTMEFEEIDTDGLEMSFDKLDVYADCLLYVIPLFETKEQGDNFVKKHYEEILTSALFIHVPEKRYWPKNLSFELFNQYFDVELHTRIVDLSSLKHKGTE